MEKYTYFWKEQSPFSQWHLVSFTVEGIRFNCAEQYMMYQKAVTFGDHAVAAAILREPKQAKQKALGRKVKNFDSAVWDEVSKQVVYDGNYAKFTQNPALLNQLLATKGTTLVEASPFDPIWGIGLRASDPRAKHRQSWQGENRLGFILTTLRDNLLVEKRSS